MIIECHCYNKFHVSVQFCHDNLQQLYSKIKLHKFYILEEDIDEDEEEEGEGGEEEGEEEEGWRKVHIESGRKHPEKHPDQCNTKSQSGTVPLMDPW